jgi:hypothetical protein
MPSSSPCWTHLKLRDCPDCVLSLCITAASDCLCSHSRFCEIWDTRCFVGPATTMRARRAILANYHKGKKRGDRYLSTHLGQRISSTLSENQSRFQAGGLHQRSEYSGCTWRSGDSHRLWDYSWRILKKQRYLMPTPALAVTKVRRQILKTFSTQ